MGMELNANGNDPSVPDDAFFEKYREHHEPVEHWELRREFLKKNWGPFSENRILCLSKTFANMEFLGCKYPMETMETVSELSRGVVEDYREQKMKRIQRTFVKASDAAEKKTKGKKPSGSAMEFIKSRDEGPEAESSSSQTRTQDYAQLWPVQTKFTMSKVTINNEMAASVPTISQKNVALQSLLRLQALSLNAPASSSAMLKPVPAERDKQPVKLDDVMKRLYQMVVGFRITPEQCKEKSIQINNEKILKETLKSIYVWKNECESNEEIILVQTFSASELKKIGDFVVPKDNRIGTDYRCNFVISGKKQPAFTAYGIGCRSGAARRDAAAKTLEFLQHIRPTIIVKDVEKRRIERSDVVPDGLGLPKLLTPTDLTNSDSIAVKIMLKSGWKGGGIGRNEDGRLFPVDTANSCVNRAGLGMKKNYPKQLEANIRELLRLEAESLYDYDIEFSPEFTKEERKIIHVVAENYGYKNQSRGGETNRRLTISRKVNAKQVFADAMKRGGDIFRYKVILPDGVLNTQASAHTVEEIMEDDVNLTCHAVNQHICFPDT